MSFDFGRTFNCIKVISKKEIIDAFRDKRSLMTSIGMVVFLSLMMPFIMQFSINKKLGNQEEKLIVPVIGKQHAPELMEYLSENNLLIEDFGGTPQSDIKEEKVKIVLEIPQKYSEKFHKSQTVTVFIHSNGSIDNSSQDRA